MNRALSHVRGLWSDNPWLALSPLPFFLWGITRLTAGELRWEYIVFLVVAPVLAYATKTTKRLFVALYPIALLALTYDAMRYVKDVGLPSADSVHLCDLRATEARLFGFSDGTTVHDWLQVHWNPWLDRIAAVPYGTFIFVEVGFAIWLFTRSERASTRFGWAFLLMNLMGFVTYHLYPAAPPWYFHSHGCAIDLAAHASEGPNLARVDAWLGVAYFHGLYARSNDVFGCVPSLHVAYPALILLEGARWMKWRGRIIAGVWSALMCFAAVYLDHHWVFDVVLGLLFATVAYSIVFFGFRYFFARRAPQRSVGTAQATT
ncbi:phosphatase PAP2 family protein [soil metagenome]